jgi:hypothetical protein
MSLDVARDLLLGPSEKMSSSEPVADPNEPAHLIGGTAFERCGQNPVKGSGRCYSLTMTHQRQRAVIGPTAALKQYEIIEDEDDSSLNLEIRGKVTKVRRGPHSRTPELILKFLSQCNARTAMMALKLGAPEDYMRLLQEHADLVNLPRVGIDENVAFPAVQANIAPAVNLQDAFRM